MASRVSNQNLSSWYRPQRGIESGCSRGLKRSYKILANAMYSGSNAIARIPKVIMRKTESTFLTERSYSKRDYIIPLSILGTMVVPSSYFIYGWQFLLGELVFQYVLLSILDQLGINSGIDDEKRKYLHKLHPFHLCLSGPIVEEVFYRGLLQNGLSLLTQVPTIGLLASSILFGYAHFHSHKKGNYGGALSAGTGGVVLGLMNQQFGIINSIYLHSLWNSIGTIGSLRSTNKSVT